VKEAPRETPVTRSNPNTLSTNWYRGLTFRFICRAAAEDGPKRIDHHADWKDNANSRILWRLELPLRRNRLHSCFLYVASVQEYPGYVKAGLTHDPQRFSLLGLTLSDIHMYQTVGYIVQRVESLTIASLRSQAHRVATERKPEIELYQGGP
jgi:hypothetical protein